MWKVLIAEDDPVMAIALEDGFNFEGYQVVVAKDGETALHLAKEKAFDLLILDVMLPKLCGYDICKELRNVGNDIAIIMLTARGQESEKVIGLKLGADDYVTKPFSFLELMARIEALKRRICKHTDSLNTPEYYKFGNISINFNKFEVNKDDKTMEISYRELGLLKYFISHRGEVVTREQLLNAVWGYNSFPLTRTVDMHIVKLRQKIEDDPGNPMFIVTIHRAGYKFTG
ncbi:MAG: two-component system OmpR family alkaline phosphatase synthesis response regulator PhoP [bacterium]|nr:MAG: two-component system OmpR family alkaline phosphatase synthesis response regulator PhoP [bacterium]